MNQKTALERLRQKCRDASQVVMAKRIGVSQPYLSMILAGKRTIAGKVARYLEPRRPESRPPRKVNRLGRLGSLTKSDVPG